MLARDTSAQALDIALVAAGPGHAIVAMAVRGDMLNGHGTCHGGLVFTLADTAFALACNNRGEPTVAAAATIEFLAPAHEGAVLTAAATEVHREGRNGVYDVVVTGPTEATTVALFRGRSRTIGTIGTIGSR
jgi:acyl-CoA thioesterase